ncbi:MAG: hypothetical protein Q9175_006241, partial [Cornicularia normoerica]
SSLARQARRQAPTPSTPYPSTLAPNEVLLEPHAWATNPADYVIYNCGELSFITYPLILGEDAAGIVVSVRSATTARFKPGDPALAVTTGPAVGKPEMGWADSRIAADVVAELDLATCAGISQAARSVDACLQIADKAKAGLFVATATPVPDDKVPSGVRAKMVFGSTLTDNEIGLAIFEDFLPRALAQRKYKVTPKPLIMGTKGLEGIQEGFNTLRNGVSARKVVIVAESSSHYGDQYAVQLCSDFGLRPASETQDSVIC